MTRMRERFATTMQRANAATASAISVDKDVLVWLERCIREFEEMANTSTSDCWICWAVRPEQPHSPDCPFAVLDAVEGSEGATDG